MEFLHGRLPVECAPQPCAQQGAELLAAAMPFLKPRDVTYSLSHMLKLKKTLTV